VVSVAVSLCCVGIEGVVKFWNVELRPMNSAATGRLEEYFYVGFALCKHTYQDYTTHARSHS